MPELDMCHSMEDEFYRKKHYSSFSALNEASQNAESCLPEGKSRHQSSLHFRG
jgi:hypothetical protein